jgi:hypothetical protein
MRRPGGFEADHVGSLLASAAGAGQLQSLGDVGA